MLGMARMHRQHDATLTPYLGTRSPPCTPASPLSPRPLHAGELQLTIACGRTGAAVSTQGVSTDDGNTHMETDEVASHADHDHSYSSAVLLAQPDGRPWQLEGWQDFQDVAGFE